MSFMMINDKKFCFMCHLCHVSFPNNAIAKVCLRPQIKVHNIEDGTIKYHKERTMSVTEKEQLNFQ